MKKIGLIILSAGLMVGTVSFSASAYSSNDRNAYGLNVDRFSHDKANYEQWNGPGLYAAPQNSPFLKQHDLNYPINGQNGWNWQNGKNINYGKNGQNVQNGPNQRSTVIMIRNGKTSTTKYGKLILRNGLIMTANGLHIVEIRNGGKIILECGRIGIDGIKKMEAF